MNHIYEQIAAERKRQDEKWGEQNHPMLKMPFIAKILEERLKAMRKATEDKELVSWYTILEEEICEAFTETDPVKQREEMVQVAAVAVQIIEYLSRQIEAD